MYTQGLNLAPGPGVAYPYCKSSSSCILKIKHLHVKHSVLRDKTLAQSKAFRVVVTLNYRRLTFSLKMYPLKIQGYFMHLVLI